MEVLMAERADLVFHNNVIGGTAIKRLISRLIDHFGMAYTSHILDQVKTLGFHQATATSISLGIDDLLTIPSKGWLVQDAEQQSSILEKHNHYGNVHAVEKLRQSIEIWYATSEYLRQQMNSNFRMTDPFNPVHIMSFSGARGNASQVHQLVGMRGLMSDPQGQMIDLPIQSNLREGLSLTEYIISCYGARKGVVDTAVRTSDAGYLTRRLVEVVQHIVVRRTDCGTIRGIYVNTRNGMMPERILIQTLIGRVVADDIYIGSRCIVVRNQDIGIGLINRFITFQTQPIFIRTPFTCRNTSWICRLCYGRSPIHGDLVELGEAVGIIAGQSIGEPGTQLTLRTFHTGGVFTGGTAEYVRAPSNGKIKFNEDLVHPTRTRHGYPAFICNIDFYVTIESDDIIHNVIIPPKSFLLVQNNQYVKSEQVIAEIRAGTSTLNLKERVQKHIYSDSEGEMHWSTDVYHTSQFIYSNVHILPKTSHLWILSGKSCRSNTIHFLLRKDQDQVTMDSLSNGKTNISNLLERNDQVKHKFNTFGTKEKWISDSSILNQIICTDHSDLMYPAILNDTFYFLAKRRRNRFLIPFPFQSIQERKNELMSPSGVSIEIPINGIFHENSIFAYFNDPQYIRQSSGITKYTTIGIHSIFQKEDFSEYQGIEEVKPKYQIQVDKIFFIPEEVHILPESSSLMEKDNLELKVVNYILYGNGKSIRGISDTRIQLVRTCLVFNWDHGKKSSSIEEAPASFIEVSTNGLIEYFLRIDLVKSNTSYIRKRNDPSGLGLIRDNQSDRINPFFSIHSKGKIQQSLSQNHGTIPKMKNGPHLKLKSGQVITVQMDSVIIRLANPYLATPEATIHGHYGEILSQGDILVTFIYEKSRSGDITQGLPKVEQILEIRSIDSISMNLEKRIDAWNECITKILGMPWGFLIGAELTIAQSRISLVNKIQKVYRSQGVHIHNRHIEIIVRQITSKVLVSEDGMSNVFLPGELIGLLRAERMGRALEEPICYRALLLGITKTSLNTQSFISEASFQETARVLAKAALRGRIDWLKGLKENVVLGGMIPVGTGFKRIMHRSRSRQHNKITRKKKLFEVEIRNLLFHHRKFFDFYHFKEFM
ncbi:unnamed protein product [Vicia faba]|uniref:DNA-directed RNA polymerase n=1 Tax=Vicia faba TaxID=3906 RepID=A0AAV0YCV6_VICFA|nr:unnamed protein product [Vicia faba]